MVTNDNYFDTKTQLEYFGASQFKTFLGCEAKGLAELCGFYDSKPTRAMLMGSYVDAYFAGTIEEFKVLHPEIFKKNGEPLKDYEKCDRIIERAKSDPLFHEYISGEQQRIMTGELFGHPFKIKIDSYFPGDKLVDLKVMKDLEPVYKDGERKSFIDAWGYDIQGYIYQQIEKCNSGKELPFYLAVITKEEEPDMEIIHIPQWRLNSAGEVIKHYVDRFAEVKRGEAEPVRCGKCQYCRSTKTLKKPIEYEDFIGLEE